MTIGQPCSLIVIARKRSVTNTRRYDHQQETKRATGDGKGWEERQGYIVSNRPIRTTIELLRFESRGGVHNLLIPGQP